MTQGTIVHDGRTDAERAYDALKDGSAYTKAAAGSCPACAEPTTPGAAYCDVCGAPVAPAQPSTFLQADAPRCTACTDTLDCPACTAKYEAERQQVIARVAAAGTATERAEILLGNHETLNGDQIFDLVMEHDIAGFVWYRAIDWVLWRQAHGKPVKRCGDTDDCPAAIDARYDAARDFAANLANFSPSSSEREVALACAGEMIEHWERTPEEEAEIRRDNELMIEILELLEAA